MIVYEYVCFVVFGDHNYKIVSTMMMLRDSKDMYAFLSVLFKEFF